MSASSRVKFIRLDGTTNIQDYSCAEGIKNKYKNTADYTFIPTSQTQAAWNKWVAYLIEMGLPLTMTGDKAAGTLEIHLDDYGFIHSPQQLLWLHGLLRLIQEPEYGFKTLVKLIYILREKESLKEYDNYQIIQLALFFENKVTEDSSGYTHLPFPTLSNESSIIIRLIKLEEAGERFKLFQNDLSIAEIASTTRRKGDILKHLKKSNSRGNCYFNAMSQLLALIGYSEGNRTIVQLTSFVDDNLAKVLAFLESVKGLDVPSVVMCTDIGSHSTLIKGNMYRIQELSKNGKTVTVRDPWGSICRTRHFKSVL